VTAAQRRTVSHPRRTARRGPAGRRVWRAHAVAAEIAMRPSARRAGPVAA